MASTAIQLRGVDQVLEAYSNIDVKIWSIYQFKNLITKGEGLDTLQQFLQMLSTNATGAIYTLKTYEDLTDPKQVKEKTEATGSLNFRLDENDFNAVGSQHYQQSSTIGRLFTEVEGLKKMMLQEREVSGPETFEQAAIGLLANPGELAQLLLAVKQLFTTNQAPVLQPPQNQTYQHHAAVGNITQPLNTVQELTEDDKLRMANAIDILVAHDPKVADHFEKLATIARDKPAQFKILLITLENF